MKIQQQFPYRNYMVAFIDVLGQKDRILSLETLSPVPDAKDKACQIMRETAFHILTLRESFQQFFELIARPVPVDNTENTEMRRNEAAVRGVSDSIIITIPLHDEGRFDIAMTGIHAVLFGICAMFLYSLVDKKPIRGGIDVGWGISLNPGDASGPGEVFTKEEIYGGALAGAYSLESKAEYPRIVIGEPLLQYLKLVEDLKPDSKSNRYATRCAKRCKRFIFKDNDGKYILDVIGQRQLEPISENRPAGATKEEKQAVQDAYNFVVDEHNRLVAQKDMKLGPRYGQLRKYFESRIQLWGIQPAK